MVFMDIFEWFECKLDKVMVGLVVCMVYMGG